MDTLPAGFHSSYVPINGLNMYFETANPSSATTVPLLVLHGAFCTTSHLRVQLVHLSHTRRVYAIEQQGHGRTCDDASKPFNYNSLMEDAVQFLNSQGIERADVYGYSMGGGVALRLAIQHPGLVRRLVVVGTVFASRGIPPKVFDAFREMSYKHLAGSQYESEYTRIAPNPAGFPSLVDRIRDLNVNMSDISDEEVQGIKADTMVVIGDSDLVSVEHAVELWRLRGGRMADMMTDACGEARLHVVPATSHAGVLTAPGVAERVRVFLERADQIESGVEE